MHNINCNCLPKKYFMDMSKINRDSTMTIRDVRGYEMTFNLSHFLNAGVKALTNSAPVQKPMPKPDHHHCNCTEDHAEQNWKLDKLISEYVSKDDLINALQEIKEMIDPAKDDDIIVEDPSANVAPNCSCNTSCGCMSNTECICKDEDFGIHVILENCARANTVLENEIPLDLPSKELYDSIKENYPESWKDAMISHLVDEIMTTKTNDIRMSLGNALFTLYEETEDVINDSSIVDSSNFD